MPLPETLDERLKPGANNPPIHITVSTPEDVRAYLEITYKDVTDRYAQLVASADAMPDVIVDDAISGQAGDLIKEIRKWDTRAEGDRKNEKEPFSKGGSTVDAFFKKLSDEMDKRKAKITARQTDYLNKKRDEERRRLQEEADKQRRESERLAREAAQSEERKIAAEDAKRAADAAEAEARENRDDLDQGRLDAESALARAKLKKANARRDRDEAVFNAATTEVEQCQAALATAKENLRLARRQQTEAAAAATRAAAQARSTTRETEAILGDAVRAEGKSDKIVRTLEKASDGDLAHNRGEHGSMNTLARRWTYDVKDRALVNENIAMLVGFIPADVIDSAIYKRMMAGNRDVPGVKYEQVSEARAV